MKILGQLRESQCKELPKRPGVYVVMAPSRFRSVFINPGTGGYFKGRDPNVGLTVLRSRWISGARELYIGKASRNLRQRVWRFLEFGCGKPVAHWGGRLIWQLKDSRNLLLAWYTDPSPNQEEKRRLQQFEQKYGQLPFANLRH